MDSGSAHLRPLLDQLTAADRYVKTDRPVASVPSLSGHSPVVFLARSTDAEVNVLTTMLNRARVPSVVIEFDSPTTAFDVDIPPTGIRIGGRSMRPSVAWIRHFNAAALPTDDQMILSRFRNESLQSFFSQLHLACSSVVNPYDAALLEQLTAAAQLGIRIPRTRVLSGSPVLDGWPRVDRVVVKALSHHFTEVAPGLLVGAFPEILTWAQFLAANFEDSPPLVVQEFVEHDAEYRVYYVADRIIAYKVSKPEPSALWRDESRVAVERCKPPDRIAWATVSLASRLRLDYAALDFLLVDGDAVFLEANLDGDWLWFENAAQDVSVTKAVLDMLYVRRSRALMDC